LNKYQLYISYSRRLFWFGCLKSC